MFAAVVVVAAATAVGSGVGVKQNTSAAAASANVVRQSPFTPKLQCEEFAVIRAVDGRK